MPKYPHMDKLIGTRFDRLIVIEYLGQDDHRHSIYICECDCGETKEVARPDLISGATRSCGCFRAENMSESPNNWKTLLEQDGLDRVGKFWRRKTI